jgi:hypothetical protein
MAATSSSTVCAARWRRDDDDVHRDERERGGDGEPSGGAPAPASAPRRRPRRRRAAEGEAVLDRDGALDADDRAHEAQIIRNACADDRGREPAARDGGGIATPARTRPPAMPREQARAPSARTPHEHVRRRSRWRKGRRMRRPALTSP